MDQDETQEANRSIAPAAPRWQSRWSAAIAARSFAPSAEPRSRRSMSWELGSECAPKGVVRAAVRSLFSPLLIRG